MRRRTQVALAICSSLAITLFVGFLVFAFTLPDPADATPERLAFSASRPAGIVALTGGAGSRIARAIELYDAGLGERVLISGVNPTLSKTELADQFTGREVATMFECCVDLGPFAKTTKGNALETRSWLRSRGYTTVYLVTSNFHLPRATVELSTLAPELTIVGVPVDSRSVPSKGWVTSPRAWWTLFEEYGKLIVVRLRSIAQPAGRGFTE